MQQPEPFARIIAWSLPGIPEISAGDNIAQLIWQSVLTLAQADATCTLDHGDIVVVTSKIVSKAEGRHIPADAVAEYLARETVRVVATRAHPGGETRIVENRLGIVAAAAGIDQSNTPSGTALLLPEDPDRSALALCKELRRLSEKTVAVLITDTLGRAWRVGQTDAAIGAAGIHVINDLRGTQDDQGRTLQVTETAVADEIASAADLVKRKSAHTPVAIVRGLSHLVTEDVSTGSARALIRAGDEDLFRLGTAEAFDQGYASGYVAGQANRADPRGGPA